MHLAEALRSAGDHAGAAAEYEEILRIDPTDRSAAAMLTMLHHPDEDDQTRGYRAVVKADPTNKMAREHLGGALMHAGDTAGAIEQYEAALRLDHNDEGTRAILAALRSGVDLSM